MYPSYMVIAILKITAIKHCYLFFVLQLFGEDSKESNTFLQIFSMCMNINHWDSTMACCPLYCIQSMINDSPYTV